CAGVAFFRWANVVSHSTNARLAFRFSCSKRGTTLRKSLASNLVSASLSREESFAERTERDQPDPRAVDLRGVEERDAPIDGRTARRIGILGARRESVLPHQESTDR